MRQTPLERARHVRLDDQDNGHAVATVDRHGAGMPITGSQVTTRRHHRENIARTGSMNPCPEYPRLLCRRQEGRGGGAQGIQVRTLAETAVPSREFQSLGQRQPSLRVIPLTHSKGLPLHSEARFLQKRVQSWREVMDSTVRAPIPDGTAPDRRLGDHESRCSACGGAIAQGEGRYRFTTQVYHVHCWEARSEDPIPERTVDFFGRRSL